MSQIVGVGIDITEVRRIKNAIDKWGDEFLERVFTKKEIEYAKGHQSYYQHLAGRFAAKEAVFKALGGNPHLGFKDVEILNNIEGKPYCSILNSKTDNLEIYLSISHIKNYALAQAIAVKKT